MSKSKCLQMICASSSDARENRTINAEPNTSENTKEPDVRALLLSAADNGEADAVERMLSGDISGGDVIAVVASLYSASLHGYEEIVRILIRHGAVDLYNDETTSVAAMKRQPLPLGAAVYGRHTDIVGLLVDAGIDVNVRDEDGDTALSVAAVYDDIEAARILLSHGAEVKVVNNGGESPLLLAVGEGHAVIVEMLLRHGAGDDLNDTDRTSLGYEAAVKGRGDVLRVLLTLTVIDTDRINDATPDGISMLFAASAGGHIGVVETLLEHGANVNIANHDNETALWVATQHGRHDIARLLVENGADVNATCDRGLSVLGVASQEQHAEMALWLLQRGANANTATMECKHPLLFAIRGRQHRLIEALLERGADSNACTHQGLSALHIAAQNDDPKSAELLLKHGARSDTGEHQHGLTPLHIAASNGYRSVLDVLLTQGVIDIEAKCSEGETALHMAAAVNEDVSSDARCEVIEALVRRGADVDATRSDGVTPLYAAALAGSNRIVATLLEHGALVNVGMDSGASPLFIAIRNGRDETVKLLLKFGANVNARPAKCSTPLFMAVELGRRDIVDDLLNHGARSSPSDNLSGWNALMIAAQHGHEDVVDTLLNHGADINEAGFNNYTPLFTAVISRSSTSSMVKKLLAMGANVNAATRHNVTPLFMATQDGKLNIVRLLLQNGAAVDGQTRRTGPVYMAARDGHAKILRLLIEYGGNVDETAVDNATALHVASTQGHLDVVELLLHANVNVNAPTNNGHSPLMLASKNGHAEIVEALIRSNADVYARNYQGETAVTMATFAGYGQVARRLRDQMKTEFRGLESSLSFCTSSSDFVPNSTNTCTNVDAEDLHGQSALHRAATAGVSRGLIELLIEDAGANHNASDFYGNTSLHEAASHCLESCLVLVQHGALVNKRNLSGKTPLHIAIESHQLDIALALLEFGADVGLADDWLNTPLHFIEYANEQATERTMNFMRSLHGARHEIPTNKNVFGHSPGTIFKSSSHRVTYCESLEEADHDEFIDSDDLGNTSLHRAVGVYDDNKVFPKLSNRHRLVVQLIEDGADVNQKNIFGHTAVHVSEDKETIEMLLRLSGGSASMATDNRGRNFWHLLAWRDEEDGRQIVSGLQSEAETAFAGLRVMDAHDRLPLHYAAMKSNDLTRDLLKLAGNYDCLTATDAFGRSPLHYSCLGGQRLYQGHEQNTNDDYWRVAVEQMETSFLESRRWKDNYTRRWSDTSWNLLEDLGSIADRFEGLSLHDNDYHADGSKTRTMLASLRPRDHDSVSYVWSIWNDSRYVGDHSKYSFKDGNEQQVPVKPNDNGSLVAGVYRRVFTFVRKLLDGIGSYDRRCFAEILPVGSAFEGTKIDYPNEFDFTVILKNLSELCEPYLSPELPPGVYRIRRNLRAAVEVDQTFGEFFNEDGHLLTSLLKTRFETCLKYTIASAELWQDESCFEIDMRKTSKFYEFSPSKACTNLRLRCVGLVDHGRHVHYGISIDIVPALYFPGWWPDDAIQHADKSIKRNGCYVVLENPRNIYPWIPFTHDYGLVSFAAAESEMLKRTPPVIRAAYVVGKQLMSRFCKRKFYTSLARKTAILYCIAQNDLSQCTGASFEEITRDELKSWVQKLMGKLLQFAVQGFVPSFFMPKYHTSVWKFEKHLKFVHLRLSQHGISFKHLFSKEYLIKHREKRSKDCHLDNILRALAYSHFIYWSVSVDSPDDITPHFPQVEPLIEVEAADLT